MFLKEYNQNNNFSDSDFEESGLSLRNQSYLLKSINALFVRNTDINVCFFIHLNDYSVEELPPISEVGIKSQYTSGIIFDENTKHLWLVFQTT